MVPTLDVAPTSAASWSNSRSAVLWIGVLFAGVVISIVLAAAIGPSNVSPITAWRIVLDHIAGGGSNVGVGWTKSQDTIVWNIRLPRSLLALLVGALLSVTGLVLQSVVRNPLADPSVLGGTSGAAVGAVLVLSLGWGSGLAVLPAAAFTGCVVGYGLTFAFAYRRAGMSPTRLVLAGVAVGYVMAALANLVVFLADDSNAVRQALYWSLGSMGGAEWSQLPLLAVVTVVGSAGLVGAGRQLNALIMGDVSAMSLGVRPDRLRVVLVVGCALLTGICVAYAGGVGFVGLVVPHVARIMVGADHRHLVPVTALLGGVFLIWADVATRMLFQPAELPIGVITALFGGAGFALLLRRRQQGEQR